MPSHAATPPSRPSRQYRLTTNRKVRGHTELVRQNPLRSGRAFGSEKVIQARQLSVGRSSSRPPIGNRGRLPLRCRPQDALRGPSSLRVRAWPESRRAVPGAASSHRRRGCPCWGAKAGGSASFRNVASANHCPIATAGSNRCQRHTRNVRAKKMRDTCTTKISRRSRRGRQNSLRRKANGTSEVRTTTIIEIAKVRAKGPARRSDRNGAITSIAASALRLPATADNTVTSLITPNGDPVTPA